MCANEFEVNGVYYYINSSSNLTVGVTYKGMYYYSYSNEYTGSVVIPECITYNGKSYSVTSIGNYAFYDCPGLTSITIPKSVKSIGINAFSYCSKLTGIEIPNSITSIGDEAFKGCSSLKKVELHCETIDSWFQGITSIEEIIIGDNVKELKDCAFNNCSGLASVTICNGVGVSILRHRVFGNCTSLTSFKIPNSVSEIGWEAFYGCTGLKNIEIPNSVTEIGSEAFNGCSGLTSIVIPNSVTKIRDYAFHGCTSLKDLRIEDGTTTLSLGYDYYSYNGGRGLFYDCPLEIIYLGRDINYETHYFYGNSPFHNKEELKSLTIGNSVTKLGDYAFRGCSSLIGIYLTHTTPPSVGSNAFTETLYTNTTLYVPQSSLTTYQSSEHWKHFLNIEEYNYDIYFYVNYIVDGEPYAVDSVKVSHAIILKEIPIRNGYTFSGWSEVPTTMPAHDVEVNGTFSINSYDLIYIVDGEEYKRVTLEFGAEIIPEEEPVKEGHTFSGWSEIPETMPAEDVIVTGSFSINSYDLVYLVDDEEYKRITLEFGSEIIPEEEPVKEGYTFSGWSEIPETMPSHDVEVTGSFIPTNVSEIIAEVSLQVNGNSISLSNANNSTVAIYSINGVLVKRIDKYTGEEITLDKGIYIVCVGDKAMKIIL